MGLLDDLLYGSPNGQGMGMLNYSSPDTFASPKKEASAQDLAAALGLNNAGGAANSPLNPVEQQMMTMAGPSQPSAPPAAASAPLSPVEQQMMTMTGPNQPVSGLGFGQGATPPLFVTPPGSTPGNPALPPAAPAPAAADEEDAPTPATGPAAPIAVGGTQMPRIGSAASFAPAANAMAQAPGAAPAPVAAPAPNFFNRAADALHSISEGGSLLGAVRGQYDDPRSLQTAQSNLTARALLAKGVDPGLVAAAVQPGNGEMLKALFNQTLVKGSHTQKTDKDGNIFDIGPDGAMTKVLEAKDDKFQHVQTGESFGGQKSFGAFNTKTGELKPDASGAAGAGGAQFGSLLAQGVQYDPNKSGPAYMAQFSPEVQSAAKAYMNGDVMPTGNARKDSIATFAKTVAQKYGQDMGLPVTDATYGAKRKMQTDLASSGNSTMGGILSNGESSFKHLAEYTASAADQGNASHNFPLGGVLAHVQNYVTNAGGGSDTQGKVKAINDNLGKYGAESTKFYAGTGGGVEERLNALKEMNATTTSGEEAASYAEKEKGLMLDRLNTKFQEIRNTLGEERGNAEIAKHMPDIQRNIATIDNNIAVLRGKAPPQAATPAAPATPKLEVGQSTTIGNTSIKRIN